MQQQRTARGGAHAGPRPPWSGRGKGLVDQVGRRPVAERAQGVGAYEGGRQRLGESGGPGLDVVLAALGGHHQDG